MNTAICGEAMALCAKEATELGKRVNWGEVAKAVAQLNSAEPEATAEGIFNRVTEGWRSSD